MSKKSLPENVASAYIDEQQNEFWENIFHDDASWSIRCRDVRRNLKRVFGR